MEEELFPDFALEPPAVGKGNSMRTLAKIARNLHYGGTIILIILLVPALHAAKLPLSFEWAHFFRTFWLGLAIQSVVFATTLYVIGFPFRETLHPLLARYQRQKLRLLILVPLCALLHFQYGLWGMILLSVVALTIFELADRTRDTPGALTKALSSFLVPAVYWFISLVLVFGLNQAVISLKSPAPANRVLNRADSWILFGATVSEVAHQALGILPLDTYRLLDFVYFSMFAQAGGCLVIIGLHLGRDKAMRFVGTIVLASFLSLLCFYLWPSTSPLYSCASHFEVLPKTLRTYLVQQQLLTYLTALREHLPLERLGAGYFIAFPCMHIVGPLISLWFLRRWKRIVAALLVYDLLLVAAIILLEFHYVTDLIGGAVVAVVSLLMVGGTNRREPTSS